MPRRGVSGAVVAAFLLGSLGPGSVSQAAPAQPITRDMRITVGGPSSLLMSLTQPLPSEAVTVRSSGKGRVVGFVLTEQDDFIPYAERGRVWSFLTNHCSSPGCRGKSGEASETSGASTPSLSEGTYRLDLIADGPARFHFTIRGLDGTSKLRAPGSSRVRVKTFKPSVYNSADGSVWAAGEFVEDAEFGAGITFMAMWVETDSLEAWDTCFHDNYDPGPTPPPEVAFYPGCAAGTDSLHERTTSDRHLYTLLATNQGFPSGQGGWFISNSPPTRMGSVGVWVPND